MAACGTIWNLARYNSNKTLLLEDSLDLLPALISVISNRDEFDTESTLKVTACLFSLSSVVENRIKMANPKYSLVLILKDLLKLVEEEEVIITTCGCLWNLGIENGNKVYMASSEVGLLPNLLYIIDKYSGEAR